MMVEGLVQNVRIFSVTCAFAWSRVNCDAVSKEYDKRLSHFSAVNRIKAVESNNSCYI